MKLVAAKWISDQLPEGSRFEIPDADAFVLITVGLARQDEQADPPAPVVAAAPVSRRRYRSRALVAGA